MWVARVIWQTEEERWLLGLVIFLGKRIVDCSLQQMVLVSTVVKEQIEVTDRFPFVLIVGEKAMDVLDGAMNHPLEYSWGCTVMVGR